MADWHESLFNSEKGDSLGDGTWGRRSADEPAITPVQWDQIGKEEGSKPKRPVRTRLATPAPGSQAESGLLDIRALAEGMKLEREAELAATARKPTPPPAEVRGAARLATAAKGSTGSGLIDVAEIVRQKEEQEARAAEAAQAVDEDEGIEASASTSSTSASSSSTSAASLASVRASSFSSSALEQSELDDDITPAGSRNTLMIAIGLLTAAFVGLAVYVLMQG